MKLLTFFCLIFSPLVCAQVGINTSNPQQELHIAGATGTLRIESLNATNNSFNGGDVDGNGDLTDNTFPLYVDENGDFTLELKTLESSEDFDAFEDTSLPTSTLYLAPGDSDGFASTVIKTYTVTVNSPRYIEVKYALSFDVYLDTSKNQITDNFARRIQTHILVTGNTRNYGSAAKCYTSGSSNSVNSIMFNSNTSYVSLPAAGTYDISFIGAVSSNKRSSGGGTLSLETYVEFATGNDFVFMRLH